MAKGARSQPAKMAKAAKPQPAATPKLDQPQPAVSYNSKTGRPIRRSAGKTASPFVDSAVAISEDDSEDSDPEQDVTTDDEGIVVVKSRKRKRSPSPPMSEASMSDSEGEAMLSDYGNAAALRNRPTQSIEPMAPMAPIQLTLNVPAGAERQIVLNIDLNSYLNQSGRKQQVALPKPARPALPAALPHVPLVLASLTCPQNFATKSTAWHSSPQHVSTLVHPTNTSSVPLLSSVHADKSTTRAAASSTPRTSSFSSARAAAADPSGPPTGES
jgi:hypothetical protein